MLRILCVAATAGLAAILMTSGPAAADGGGYGYGYSSGYGYGPSYGNRARARHWRRMQRRRMAYRYGQPRVQVNNYYNGRPDGQRRVVNNYYG